MANLTFDDLIPQGTQTNESPYAAAISSIESSGNYKAVGPATRTGDRALGKYQIMSANIRPWSQEVLGREVTPTEFMNDPKIQDAIFNGKFGRYVEKYGPEGASKAWFAGEKGMNDPNRRDVLGTTVDAYGRKFTQALGYAPEQPRGPQVAAAPQAAPQTALSFDDLIPQQPDGFNVARENGVTRITPAPFKERFEQPVPPAPPELATGLNKAADQYRQQARGPATASAGQQVALEFMNQGSAAGQGTTPNIDAQMQNFISADVHENDAGEVLYRDPSTGELVPTDQNKHVALRDPQDGKIKIFRRSEATDEGRLSAAGRLLGTGMAAGAPTARPAIPAIQAAKPLAPGQEVAAAAARLSESGMPVTVPRAVATDSMATQRAAAVTRNIPFAGDPLVKSAERTIGQLGAKADEVAQGFGGNNVAGAGDTARDSIRTYLTQTSKDVSNKFYNRVDELVDNSVKTDLAATRQAAGSITARRENAAISEASGAVKRIDEAINRPGGLNYEGIKDLRTYIGELKDNPSLLPSDISGKELDRIYSSLTIDLKNAVRNAGGPQAATAFDRANRHYALLSERREALAKIIGKDGSVPAEQVFERLVAMASSSGRADIAKLAQARKVIGAEEWNDFVSGVIGRMGRDTANFAGPERLQEAGFSPQRFLTAYGKLSDAGKSILFRSGGKSDLASHLDDIARVSTRFKELQKFSNPSGTSQNVMGGGIGAGLVAHPLATIGAVVGGRTLATLLSRPATASSVAKVVRSQEALVRNPTTPRIAAFMLSARNLINTAGEGGRNLSPSEFLKALQGGVPARAENE